MIINNFNINRQSIYNNGHGANEIRGMATRLEVGDNSVVPPLLEPEGEGEGGMVSDCCMAPLMNSS